MEILGQWAGFPEAQTNALSQYLALTKRWIIKKVPISLCCDLINWNPDFFPFTLWFWSLYSKSPKQSIWPSPPQFCCYPAALPTQTGRYTATLIFLKTIPWRKAMFLSLFINFFNLSEELRKGLCHYFWWSSPISLVLKHQPLSEMVAGRNHPGSLTTLKISYR